MLPGSVPYTWRGSYWDAFEWKMMDTSKVVMQYGSNVVDSFFMEDLKHPNKSVQEHVNDWRTFRPDDPVPDLVAVSNGEDEYRWFFTRVAPFEFRVYCHNLGYYENAEIIDAGKIFASLSHKWRLLRLYVLFAVHFLRDLPRAAEKVFRPDGEGMRACAKRFKAMAAD